MGHYELGKEYFIKAMVADIVHDGQYPLRVLVPVNTPLTSDYTSINMANVPGLLLTAEEVASGVKDAMHTELVKTNAALSNEIGTKNRDIANLERAVEELRVENESFRKQIDEHKKLFEENGKVAMDLATQRDNFKKHLETALKDFAEKDKACTDALRDKADLQKALEALNKDIDGYRATIQKMASVIGFLCGTEGGKNG
jgi:chromosome segregation ATPase